MSQSNFIEMVSAAFTAGQSKIFMVSGQYFELIDAPGPVDVYLVDRYGAQRGVMRAAEASFNLKSTDFNQIQIVSPTAQTIRFAYGTGEAGTRRAAGAVTISGTASVTVANTGGAFTQAQKTVTNASAQVFAAKTNRRYLLIQNNDPAGIVYVMLNGAAATVADGLAIQPGGSLELQGYVTTGAINAIGSIANNANCVAVEA